MPVVPSHFTHDADPSPGHPSALWDGAYRVPTDACMTDTQAA